MMESIVTDSFDIKGRVAIEYGAAGVVVVFGAPPGVEAPQPGSLLLVIRPDGWMARTKIGEVKAHGPDGYGIFLGNLTKQDVPIGSRIRWGSEFWPSANEEKYMASSLTHA